MLRSRKFWKGRSRKLWEVGVGNFGKIGVGYFTSDSATLLKRNNFLRALLYDYYL